MVIFIGEENNMKKEFNKILLIIGFIVSLIGVYISAAMSEILLVNVVWSTANIAMLLSVTFVFSKNYILKNIGYILSLLLGAQGVLLFLGSPVEYIGSLVTLIGYAIMAVAALVYFVIQILKFFGFVKIAGTTKNDNVIDEINSYGDLKKDGIITDEEFFEIKQKLLNGSAKKKDSSMDDLKKWKKLLDQEIINEAEFANVKKNFLNN